jgi:hypothetical protein
MTFYLGNKDVRPVGAEAGEFIDAPILRDPPRADEGDEDDDSVAE